MPISPTTPLRVALISSGLGCTARGIETWMVELAAHLPDDIFVELWSGGPVPSATARAAHSLHGMGQ